MIRKDSVTKEWYHHIWYLSSISNHSTLPSQVPVSIRMKINKDQNEVCHRGQLSLDQSRTWLVLKDDVAATHVVIILEIVLEDEGPVAANQTLKDFMKLRSVNYLAHVDPDHLANLFGTYARVYHQYYQREWKSTGGWAEALDFLQTLQYVLNSDRFDVKEGMLLKDALCKLDQAQASILLGLFLRVTQNEDTLEDLYTTFEDHFAELRPMNCPINSLRWLWPYLRIIEFLATIIDTERLCPFFECFHALLSKNDGWMTCWKALGLLEKYNHQLALYQARVEGYQLAQSCLNPHRV